MSHRTRERPVECLASLHQLHDRLCAVAVSLLLRRIGRWNGREIPRFALTLARSAQAERDNESRFFVPATVKDVITSK
ncbi:hypothetical protein EVAR_23804_1 [Eumeta japonica]|uniref:Uncharacterized protein n=1 Tax=Eumeta variegata TaxID=151549 RepID=A0A4C1VLE7_EUMVA|nr:hypothetical protein EVAR_23804_1 [Eumeta japonica]